MRDDKIGTFADHVKRTGKIPYAHHRGNRVARFKDRARMRDWWRSYKRHCKTSSTLPDARILAVDVLREDWEEEDSDRKICAFVSLMRAREDLPSIKGKRVAKFRNGTDMRVWWGSYKAKCALANVSPDPRLLDCHALRADWEVFVNCHCVKKKKQKKRTVDKHA